MSNCPICSSLSTKNIQNYRGNSRIFQEKVLMKCFDCNFVFIDPMLNDIELSKYNSEYFLNAHGGIPSHPIEIAFHRGINKIRVNHVLNYINSKELFTGNVLEIGPGTGDFLDFFKELNPDANYSIIESDINNLERLKAKVKSFYSDLSDVPDTYFDLIIISHVLEHTNNPVLFLNLLRSKLNQNGFLFIEVPCEDYLFKEKEEPHLLFFNKLSMNKILTICGFSKFSITYHGPDIKKNKVNQFLVKVYSKILTLSLKVGIELPISYLFPSMRKFLTNKEISAILPFNPMTIKENPSWWLRVMSQKN